MKTISLAVLVSFLVLSGLALAAQSGEQRDHSSMMQEMMKGGKQGEQKDGMMRMMKMMDQCAAMMESAHGSEGAKENQKK
jgi:prophage maintenance system killer protein